MYLFQAVQAALLPKLSAFAAGQRFPEFPKRRTVRSAAGDDLISSRLTWLQDSAAARRRHRVEADRGRISDHVGGEDVVGPKDLTPGDRVRVEVQILGEIVASDEPENLDSLALLHADSGHQPVLPARDELLGCHTVLVPNLISRQPNGPVSRGRQRLCPRGLIRSEDVRVKPVRRCRGGP